MTSNCVLDKRIAILLSSYNGSSYIAEQIQSIQSQTYKNWVLYIRDDGSTDNTEKIIHEFMSHDNRIILLHDSIKHRGVRDSFMHLLKEVDSEYFMFCDQDDVWLPTKIEESYRMLLSYEKNEKKPIIVCSDLKVANYDLKIINNSIWHQNHVTDLLFNVAQNLAIAPMFAGCGMIFNNYAKKICLSITPYNLALHDNHLTLSVVSKGGMIIPLQNSLMLYRQHENNVLGTYRGEHYILHKLKRIVRVITVNKEQYMTAKYYLNISFVNFLILKFRHLLNVCFNS